MVDASKVDWEMSDLLHIELDKMVKISDKNLMDYISKQYQRDPTEFILTSDTMKPHFYMSSLHHIDLPYFHTESS